MEEDSHFYAEEFVMGNIKKLKGTVGEVVPNRKIVFKCSFPVSLASPKFEWLIEPKGSNSVFTAILYMRCERFYLKFFKKEIETAIEFGKKHMKEEGENFKKLLEKGKD